MTRREVSTISGERTGSAPQQSFAITVDRTTSHRMAPGAFDPAEGCAKLTGRSFELVETHRDRIISQSYLDGLLLKDPLQAR